MISGLVKDFLTGRMIKGFIPDPAHPGQYLCNEDGCGKPTGHHNYAVCWEHTPEPFRPLRAQVEHADKYDREFIEIVMQGESVRQARELRAIRNRKPMMGERRATGCGELDLGEIS